MLCVFAFSGLLLQFIETGARIRAEEVKEAEEAAYRRRRARRESLAISRQNSKEQQQQRPAKPVRDDLLAYSKYDDDCFDLQCVVVLT